VRVSLLPDEVLYSGVATLSEQLRTRQLSPVALTESCLARLQRLGPGLGAVVTLTAELALEQARSAEAELARGAWRGPLHGIPYGLKDLIDTQGIATTWGARPFAGRVPGEDATVVTRLAAAGAVLCAKLSMIELAGGLGYHTGAAALNGPCRTPWDLGRWAGGSSSGPASAVAAGLLPFAIGSETLGSITCPAAFCGVTGLRPTYGVLSRFGVMPLSFTLDKLGPFTRSALDAALVLAALVGEDPRDPSSIQPPPGLPRVRAELTPGLRVAVLGFEGVPPARRWAGAVAAFERVQVLLRQDGALLEPAALPDLPWEPLAEVFIEAEAASVFEELIRSGRTRELADASHRTRRPQDYLPRASSADYVRAMRLRGEAQRAMARFFERYDLVLAPNLPVAPPRAEEVFDDALDLPDPLGAAGNLCGLPALALPMGLVEGLPVSLQLVGPPLAEARLLSAGAWLQRQSDYHLARPPL
jgi:aspartyl-tRNA(Asn)/glutamyl-tRNA(Gln) amidotransferase subunit A